MSSDDVDVDKVVEVEQKLEDLQVSVDLPKTCWKLEDLTLVEPIKNICEKSKFRIVGLSSKYNEINIIPVDVIDQELFQLHEEILDVVEDPESGLGRIPLIKEIVLAPKDMTMTELNCRHSTEYQRGIIIKIYPKKMVVDIYFVDTGGFQQVKIQELKRVNEAVMKYPVLGHLVVLQDVHGDNKLILKTIYDTLMKELLNTDFNVQLGKRRTTGAVFTEKYKVILSHMSGKLQIFLSEQIKQLEIWEWEKFSNGRGTDDEICSKGLFGMRTRTTNGETPIESINVPIGKSFTAKVSHVFLDESTNQSCLQLVLLNLPLVENFFNVLHAQMERYCSKIACSNFFPCIEEYVMFKLDKKDEYVEIDASFLDRWCRGLRSSEDIIYLLDFDSYIPFLNINREDYEMRRLYGEFNTIPVLSARIYPQEKGQPVPFEKVLTIFERNKRYNFQTIRTRDDGGYDATFDAKAVPDKG